MLSVSPTTLSIDGLGSTYALNFLAQETGYSGAFTESDTCGGIATISPSSATGPMQTYTVTGIAAGTCSVTIEDSFLQKGSVAVTVTTGNFVIMSHHRAH